MGDGKMILDGYENNRAYADEDRTFVHLNPDEYVLEDTAAHTRCRPSTAP